MCIKEQTTVNSFDEKRLINIIKKHQKKKKLKSVNILCILTKDKWIINA